MRWSACCVPSDLVIRGATVVLPGSHRWERERAMTGRRDNAWGETAGRGWGNQSGESWHRDRPGAYDLGTSGFRAGFEGSWP